MLGSWNKPTGYSKLLAVIVLAGAIWLGFYFKSEFKKVADIKPSLASETKSDINTSDWKTYKNEKYGFEFKYPNYWGDLIDGYSESLAPNKMDYFIKFVPNNTTKPSIDISVKYGIAYTILEGYEIADIDGHGVKQSGWSFTDDNGVLYRSSTTYYIELSGNSSIVINIVSPLFKNKSDAERYNTSYFKEYNTSDFERFIYTFKFIK
jgi:hypothetical protein